MTFAVILGRNLPAELGILWTEAAERKYVEVWIAVDFSERKVREREAPLRALRGPDYLNLWPYTEKVVDALRYNFQSVNLCSGRYKKAFTPHFYFTQDISRVI